MDRDGVEPSQPKATDLQSAELTIAQPVLLERVVRIELTASAWKAEVLPLYDTRLKKRGAGRTKV